MSTIILGISAFYHDSAAALLVDGEIIAAAQEERFTRIKHDAGFPRHAVDYVMSEAGISITDITAIAFYDKPLLKFERLLETYHSFAPRGLSSFLKAMPVWVKEKVFAKRMLRKHLGITAKNKIPLLFPEHHLSHAASAFFPSPFDEAAIVTIDGVGEWATTSICYGKQNQIKVLRELHFPHSIGLLYSAFTYYLGFKVNSGEYKLMGLAPYGHSGDQETQLFKEKILAELVDIREDGSILLNMDYFNYAAGLTMIYDKKWERLFGMPRRKQESTIGQAHMNMALAIQEVIEKAMLLLVQTAHRLTGSTNLVMAGGVALNCVANSKIKALGLFDQLWIQPAAGDAGGALGAALAAHYIWAGKEREKLVDIDGMKNSYLGPEYSGKEIKKLITQYRAVAKLVDNLDELCALVSEKIAAGRVVGWFQGRMEFGPRSLGNRSILADPRNPEMQKKLNLQIKYREGFRPFAPSVLAEEADVYFEMTHPSPYMLFVEDVKKSLRKPEPKGYDQMELYERLYHLRSSVPAITHVDYSARVQTVEQSANPRFWQLIRQFGMRTGCSMLINTSFNRRGEPMVCSPEDAYLCFMHSEMDFLVLGDYVLDKKDQVPLPPEPPLPGLD